MSDLYEKVKLLDLEVYDYKKRQQETETKMKHDKDLFETVRNERNQAGKSLLEAKVCVVYYETMSSLTNLSYDRVVHLSHF